MVQLPVAHGAAPSVKPAVGETNVTDCGANSAGTGAGVDTVDDAVDGADGAALVDVGACAGLAETGGADDAEVGMLGVSVL